MGSALQMQPWGVSRMGTLWGSRARLCGALCGVSRPRQRKGREGRGGLEGLCMLMTPLCPGPAGRRGVEVCGVLCRGVQRR